MASGVATGKHSAPPPPRAHLRLLVVCLASVVVIAALIGVAVDRQRDRERSTAAAGAATPSTATGSASSSTLPADGATAVSGATATSTTEAPSTTTTVPGPSAITLAFAGDLLPHMPLVDQAAAYGDTVGRPYDFAPMLAPMAPILEAADVAICHMEVPLAPPGEAVTSYPSFGAPPEIVEGIRSAGYDGCSTASNHSLDRGRAGLKHLLDRFDQQQLRHAGTARVPAEGGGVATVYDVQGVRVAHLSYSYDFNGYKIPADAPWSVNQIDPARIAGDAATARAGGADLVVVSLHWGDEYRHDPSADQRSVADQLLPSPDIDLIIGHHAHVVQPIEVVDGTYVVWGLGNQLSNQTQDPRRDGLTVVVSAGRTGDGWGVSSIEAVPTFVELGSFRVLPVVATLADPSTPAALRADLSASYDRTHEVLAAPGTSGLALAPKP